MDGQFWITLLKILVFFPFVIALILIFGKMGSKLNLNTNNKYMKILERLPISKDNTLLVVKVGEKGFLMSSSTGKIEILREIDGAELESINELNKANMLQLQKGFESVNLNKLNNLKVTDMLSKLNLSKIPYKKKD